MLFYIKKRLKGIAFYYIFACVSMVMMHSVSATVLTLCVLFSFM